MINNVHLSYGALLLFSVTTVVAALSSSKIQNETNVWAIYGEPQANDPEITKRYHRGNDSKSTQIIILNKPFSDSAILPYTKMHPATNKSISVTATAGEYEPASFVIQSSNQQLRDVKIVASDLTSKNNKNTIDSTNIDLRIVKAWFQSSEVMRRSDRNAPKRLVPELLLHDNQLVKVDFNNQTNSIRTHPAIIDADTLLPFNMPANFNQQIWLTLLTPAKTKPGYYTGQIKINAITENKETFTEIIEISLRVLPFQLQDTSMLMGQFYLARLVKPTKTYFNARGKNKQQMAAELKDMKEHGVNQVTVDHAYNNKAGTEKNTIALSEQIKLIKNARLTTNPIIYLDWKVGNMDNETQYLEKLHAIKKTFSSEGITDFWVYNRDEKKLAALKKTQHTFDAAHNIGAKNIVAITKPKIAKHLKGQLDLALIQHSTSINTIDELKTAGVIPVAYGLPHAGEEKPETTRYTYGLRLIEKGFAGTLSYAYQAGECWDDWMHWEKSNYRPNVMAYPTSTDPIPTMQWEAWREGVDDLKYLETYAQFSGKTAQEIINEAHSKNISKPSSIRDYLIEQILIFSERQTSSN